MPDPFLIEVNMIDPHDIKKAKDKMHQTRKNRFGWIIGHKSLANVYWALIFILPLFLLIFSCATSEGEDPMKDTKEPEVGDVAPDFSLLDQNGERITLKDFLGNRVVVLYFYPKDNTSVCTAQACGFRDNYVSFSDAGAEVIGISSDSVESHQGFSSEHQLPFHLLSDEDGRVRKRYGASALLGIPGRVTYVIDKQGVIQLKFSSMFSADKHIQEALDLVRTLD